MGIIPERLDKLVELKGGNHVVNDGAAMCAMEAAAWIAGEPWSDHPECVCPVIGAFMRSWNDSLPDDRRTELLLPLIATTIGTRGSADLANRHAMMAMDWLIHVHTPAWLRLAGLTAQADTLANLPEITDFAKTPSLMPTIEAVRKDASAARDAAGGSAWTAAWTAAWAAAAAGAAVTPEAVAEAVAWGAAASAAAGAKFAPTTVIDLQASAVDLVKRMCALVDEPAADAA